MRKVIYSVLLALLLVGPLTAQRYNFDKSEEKHIRVFVPKTKDHVPPSVKKCLTVKCQDGYYCFHGRCVELDNQCLNVKCAQGTRCVKGNCVERKHRPKRVICAPLDFKLSKQRCDKDLMEECKKNKMTPKSVCGFNPKTREHHDYLSACDACAEKSSGIRFFYETTCDDAPRICEENQECMNGICTTIFDGAEFENKESCNQNSECDPTEYCTAHKCIDKRDIFNYLDSLGQVNPVLLKVA